ncbi:IMPACT family protein [Luteibacter aegosomaticola]|uniref:IMPACT family protein n=1 Tax=Luteibacter aegosomaticola TaxID=2911538 RepID=UPI001FF8B60D|nr:YigZ family protein [Luteibacter aegosomaticola]UPG91969.1 IMPACT family protein [Luteibacter aegosomaticola]
MSTPLATLAAPFRHEEEIKKSRFIAQAAPVTAPADALAFFQSVGDPGATHNCWAYRIGDAYRFNDDGEPGGTAGRPILAAIDGQGCDRVAVVVTRWYGGIKLGAGGLVRAYGGSAAECLRLAPRVPIIATGQLTLRVDFADLALVTARIRELDGTIDEEHFLADGATLIVSAPVDQLNAITVRLVDATRGRTTPKPLDA